MSTFKWPRDLDYFETGEWQWIEEKLDELDHTNVSYNPSRKQLFAALHATPFETVRCAIIGQDPYPDARFCTGIAFSTPSLCSQTPSTLVNIFAEYATDLHYPTPSTGDLSGWCKSGVLLWNVYPTCETNKAGSHRWPEWEFLTKEIIERLSNKGVVFVLLGSVAQAYAKYITEASEVLNIGHPSPLANMKNKDGTFRAKTPFLGSRMFTKVNDLLCTHKLGEPINWRLE